MNILTPFSQLKIPHFYLSELIYFVHFAMRYPVVGVGIAPVKKNAVESSSTLTYSSSFQFCFGSTYVQLNPNFRKFDRMDPMTWKKEGIASKWTGARGYR